MPIRQWIKISFLTCVSLLLLQSCNRVKQKSHQLSDKAKDVVAEKKTDLSDKIIAHYDPYHPDTRFNKKRFSEFFLFAPTPDVKNLYCYADEMGIDHTYQFAFNCDTVTANKIIFNLHLHRIMLPDDEAIGFWEDFPWWDGSKIETLKPFFKKGIHETYWYLWYDTINQKAYYLSFDM